MSFVILKYELVSDDFFFTRESFSDFGKMFNSFVLNIFKSSKLRNFTFPTGK